MHLPAALCTGKAGAIAGNNPIPQGPFGETPCDLLLPPAILTAQSAWLMQLGNNSSLSRACYNSDTVDDASTVDVLLGLVRC